MASVWIGPMIHGLADGWAARSLLQYSRVALGGRGKEHVLMHLSIFQPLAQPPPTPHETLTRLRFTPRPLFSDNDKYWFLSEAACLLCGHWYNITRLEKSPGTAPLIPREEDISAEGSSENLNETAAALYNWTLCNVYLQQTIRRHRLGTVTVLEDRLSTFTID